MEFLKLFENIEITETNIDYARGNIEISGISANSSKVMPGFIFVCLTGTKTDGHMYIGEAMKNGAVVIVAENRPFDKIDKAVPYVLVKNTREAEAKLWMKWYGEPANGIKIIGITGTNGKTSVSYMINQILNDAGYKTALFGTIKYIIGDIEEDARLTTLDPEEMAKYFRMAKDESIDYVIMEISSHSLELNKTAGLGTIRIGVFTNLTQDHLDFHGNMESYKKAKAKLFQMCKTGVLNADDEALNDIASASSSRNYFYGIKSSDVDFTAENIKYHGVNGSEYDFVRKSGCNCEECENNKECANRTCRFKIKSLISGEPYIYNTLAAAAVGKLLSVDDDIISGALKKVRIRGRIENLDINTGYSVFIDYAHTPDALENVLRSVRTFACGRIITVFGCGGDRDKTKRPLMGKIAYSHSDFCVVTSDNSRTEEPTKIINDIVAGIEELTGTETAVRYKTVADRKEAIEYAMDIAVTGDVILLAGKGHEDYIIGKDGVHHFSEREIVYTYAKKGKKL